MKLLKRTLYFCLSLILLTASGLSLSSCSGSKGCNYDASRYQIKNSRTGINRNYKPSSFKHTDPIRKKWIINNKKKPILGHK